MNDRVGSKEKAVEIVQALDASSVAGARVQTNPDGDISIVSKSEGLPADVRNRLEGHRESRS